VKSFPKNRKLGNKYPTSTQFSPRKTELGIKKSLVEIFRYKASRVFSREKVDDFLIFIAFSERLSRLADREAKLLRQSEQYKISEKPGYSICPVTPGEGTR
jgi:hypothetical protein